MELKRGYKQTDVGVIPEEWRVKTVGELAATKVIDKPLDGNHGDIHPKSSDYVGYGIPFVMANNISGGRIDYDTCKFLTKERADRLQKGFSVSEDVLLTHKGTVGNTAIVGPLTTDYIMLTPQVTYYRVREPQELNNSFLRYYFDSGPFQSLFLNLSGGGTRAYLGIVRQLTLPIVLPPIIEQRAIARALGDVDALIAALEKLIAKKRDLKQAAMQQLLTGQTRLPDFTGEWEKVTAGEIGRFRGGNGFPVRYQGAIDGAYPFFKVSDMNNKGNDTFMFTSNNWVSESLRKAIGATLFPAKSIVFAKVGAAIFLERKKILAQPGCIDNNMMAFVLDTRRADCRFVHYLLLATKLAAFVATTALPSLSGRQLSNMSLRLPPLHEQTAMAGVLSDIDAELGALEQRLDKTRALKQGMMQELLTGRTRLV